MRHGSKHRSCVQSNPSSRRSDAMYVVPLRGVPVITKSRYRNGTLRLPRSEQSDRPTDIPEHAVGFEVLACDLLRGGGMAVIVVEDFVHRGGRLADVVERDDAHPDGDAPNAGVVDDGGEPAREVTDRAITEPTSARDDVPVLGDRELCLRRVDEVAVRGRIVQRAGVADLPSGRDHALRVAGLDPTGS